MCKNTSDRTNWQGFFGLSLYLPMFGYSFRFVLFKLRQGKVTYFAHAVHRFAEEIRNTFLGVKKLISLVIKAFMKAWKQTYGVRGNNNYHFRYRTNHDAMGYFSILGLKVLLRLKWTVFLWKAEKYSLNNFQQKKQQFF